MDYEKIESEYQRLVDLHAGSKRKATGIKTVLQFLLEYPDKIWWWSWEFIGRVNSKGEYLSHRAPARASDLAIHHPTLVEDRKIGKFAIYRLRKENIKDVLEFLGESTNGAENEDQPVATFESKSRLGMLHYITERDRGLACTCPAYKFSPDGGKGCKHIQEFLAKKSDELQGKLL